MYSHQFEHPPSEWASGYSWVNHLVGRGANPQGCWFTEALSAHLGPARNYKVTQGEWRNGRQCYRWFSSLLSSPHAHSVLTCVCVPILSLTCSDRLHCDLGLQTCLWPSRHPVLIPQRAVLMSFSLCALTRSTPDLPATLAHLSPYPATQPVHCPSLNL